MSAIVLTLVIALEAALGVLGALWFRNRETRIKGALDVQTLKTLSALGEAETAKARLAMEASSNLERLKAMEAALAAAGQETEVYRDRVAKLQEVLRSSSDPRLVHAQLQSLFPEVEEGKDP